MILYSFRYQRCVYSPRPPPTNKSNLFSLKNPLLKLPGPGSSSDNTGLERHLVAICNLTQTHSTPQKAKIGNKLKPTKQTKQKMMLTKNLSNQHIITEAWTFCLQGIIWRKLRAMRKAENSPKKGGGDNMIPRAKLAISEAGGGGGKGNPLCLAEGAQHWRATEQTQHRISKRFP